MKKYFFVILVVIFFALQAPLWADNLIVPGERIGDYYLNMSADDIISRLGYSSDKTKVNDTEEKWWYGNYIGFGIYENKVHCISLTDNEYQWKTQGGIGLGSSFEDVKQSLGVDYDYYANENEDSKDYNDYYMDYYMDGIYFCLKNNIVVNIMVSEPYLFD